MGAKKIVKTKVDLQPSPDRFFIIAAAVLIIITSAIYLKSLNNELTRWDDYTYITGNQDIKTLHGDSIKYTLGKTFSSYVVGNYHPLTMLSLCIDYELHQLNPKAYHSTSLIIHILNSLLVFAFAWLLSKQKWVAFITALLFAVHPMHVESVAWASERKDVLYAFFYLLALCTYILYITKEPFKNRLYLITFFVFIFAVLSKAMAVSLPIAFFIIDYFFGRKITKKTILEKVPFIVISLVFGYVAIKAQESINAMADVANYNFFNRILFSSYGLILYLWKMIVPLSLSCYYNYPVPVNGMYPFIIYIAPVIVIALLFLIYKSMRYGKDIFFGSAFFLITIALVLQILPVGGAIIADRYTYLPYIGLFFITARLFNNVLADKYEKLKNLKKPLIFVFTLFIIMCCYLSFERTKVWRDGLSLWSDAIEKKDVAPICYKSRGDAYYLKKQYDKALADYEMAISGNYKFMDVYFSKGATYYELHEYEKVIENLNLAIQINNNYADAYNLRGMAYFNLAKYKEAIDDMNKLLEINPQLTEAYYTRGSSYLYLGKYQEAINDLTMAISNNSNTSNAYNNRGIAYFNLKKTDEALADYSYTITYNPQSPNTYFNRALVYDSQQKYNAAIADYTATIQLLPNYAATYYNRGVDYSKINKHKEALSDVLKAKELGHPVDPGFVENLKNKLN
jgi:protein O-mannosyl-transferase